MTSINDVSDLARIIREQPEWADTLRGILMGQELLELPAKLAEFVEATHRHFQVVNERLDLLERRLDLLERRFDMLERRFDAVEARLDVIERRLDVLEARMNRLEGKLDNALGANYALKVEKNIGSIIRPALGLRRVQVLMGTRKDNDSELMDIIDQAEDDGIIAEAQTDDLYRADLILTGQARGDRAGRRAVAEISITIGDSDIERAARRARVLEAATGETVVPVVIGAYIDEARTRLAAANGVAVALEPDDY